MPTPAMVAWARELQVGSWYMLDYRGRNEQVQLAWRGLRKQLTLFVSPQGPRHPVPAAPAGGFPAGRPAGAGAGRVAHRRATRSALAKLDVDPSRLAELSGRPRLVDEAVLRRDEEFVEDQRVGLLAQAPEHHQHDDLQVFQVERAAA